jgi:hypothetical protein
MAPRAKSAHGTPNAQRKRLKKEVERLAGLTPEFREARIGELVEFAAPTLRWELAQYGVEENEDTERGVMLTMLMHKLGLGVPPDTEWTIETVKFILKTLYLKAWTRAQMSTKATACATLRTVMKEAESDAESEQDEEPDVAKQLFQRNKRVLPTPQPSKARKPKKTKLTPAQVKANKRKKLQEELDALGDTSDESDSGEEEPASKARAKKRKKKPPAQPAESDSDPQEEAHHHEDAEVEWGGKLSETKRLHRGNKFVGERGDLTLSGGESGWKSLVNFGAAQERLPADYRRERMRGMNFLTAAAVYMGENSKLMDLDPTGLGTAPMEVGNEEQTSEWLGAMYAEGVRRMGRGATFDLVNFSKVANKGLAGLGAQPPDPMHLAGFFGQLFHAGDSSKSSAKHSTVDLTGEGSDGKRDRVHVRVPEAVLESVITAAEKAAPSGLDLDIIAKAVHGVASRQGANFRDKLIMGLRSFGVGRKKGEFTHTEDEDGFTAAVMATQQTEAVVSLSCDALRSARISKGNADILNPESPEFFRCVVAVIQRKFTSKDFKLSLLVPRVQGCPTLSELAAAFGEAETCYVLAESTNIMTEEEDRFFYPWLASAINTLCTLDVVSLDFGFGASVKWFADMAPSLSANGAPFSQCTRVLARLLVNSERQRKQELLYATNVTEADALLSYEESEEGKDSKLALQAWSRERQAQEMIQWQRCYEVAATRMGHVPVKPRKMATNLSGAKAAVTFAAASPTTLPAITYGSPASTGNQLGGSRNAQNQIHVAWKEIDREKWRQNYGIGTGGTALCWFHCNRPGGCTQGAQCENDHSQYPTAYGDKALSANVAMFQKEVALKCRRP